MRLKVVEQLGVSLLHEPELLLQKHLAHLQRAARRLPHSERPIGRHRRRGDDRGLPGTLVSVRLGLRGSAGKTAATGLVFAEA